MLNSGKGEQMELDCGDSAGSRDRKSGIAM